MERIALGPDGIGVSRLCLGAMALGTQQDEAASFAILDRFIELGGNFIDTANCYMFWEGTGPGTSRSCCWAGGSRRAGRGTKWCWRRRRGGGRRSPAGAWSTRSR
nr:hypothetical protein GCM10025732_38080 [Glycomyces mayteni]